MQACSSSNWPLYGDDAGAGCARCRLTSQAGKDARASGRERARGVPERPGETFSRVSRASPASGAELLLSLLYHGVVRLSSARASVFSHCD